MARKINRGQEEKKKENKRSASGKMVLAFNGGVRTRERRGSQRRGKAVNPFQDRTPAPNKLANAYQMLGSVGCQSMWQSGSCEGGFHRRADRRLHSQRSESCLFAYLSWPSRLAARVLKLAVKAGSPGPAASLLP